MSLSKPAESRVNPSPLRSEPQNRQQPPVSYRDSAENPRKARILAATAEIERQVAAEPRDFGAALQVITARTLTMTSARGAAIGLIEGDEIVCCAAAGAAPDVGARIGFEHGLLGEFIRSGKIVRSDDTAHDARLDQAACQALNLRSAVALPIRCTGEIIGVLEILSAEPNAFDHWAVFAMSRMADFVGQLSATTPPPLAKEAPRLRSGQAPGGRPLLKARTAAGLSRLPSGTAVRARAFQVNFSSCTASLTKHRGWCLALLLMAALGTAVAASYRVAAMIRSARQARRGVELTAPALPPVSSDVASVPAAPPEPASAREYRRPGRILISEVIPAAEHRRFWAKSRVEVSVVLPAMATVKSPGAARRKVETPPDPPHLAVVQQAALRDTVIAPLVHAPVAAPQLAAPAQATQPPPAQAKPGKSKFPPRIVGRKLKVLVQRDQKKAGDPPKFGAQPQKR